MPNTVTITAWEFDPAFQLGPVQRPIDWVGSASPDGNSYQEVGTPIDLGSALVTVTISDGDEDELLIGGNTDSFSIGGTVYNLDLVYSGDQVTIDSQTYTLVTLYGESADGIQTAITLPIQSGKITSAFAGLATGTEWLFDPNQFDLPFSDIPCFARGTIISTSSGGIAVEDLSVGDLVLTKDAGSQPIRWIGSRKLDAVDLNIHPNLRPIRICAGALGAGLPKKDLLVSPQHRVFICSAIAQNMFGIREILVAAKQLLSINGIEIANDVCEVEYWHFMFDHHAIILSNGAETESLYTGTQALKSLGPKARKEIFAIFPELEQRGDNVHAEGARPFLTGRQGRKLAQAHARKLRDLVSQA